MAERIQVDTDVYDTYRKQIEHEDELIGMRNGWLIGGQAFLFAAYAGVLEVQGRGAAHGFASAAHQLFNELPAVGIALAALALLAVLAALLRSRQLVSDFKNRYSPPPCYPQIMSKYPRLIGHSVACLIPILFIGSWIVVFSFR